MRYSLRTLVLLTTIIPPVVGFWPEIRRAVIYRAIQINASDVIVATAASTMLLIRWRVDRQTEWS